ncbi:hypothetical protein I601_0260 [Nocardioides dokdonensis FR1436]|uniref:Uncharacterized protein n=2 Tax=Nocardioides TaxID=1839 RepID=A0A1A9GGG8_9ACTN|nr:hypothetical protein I601_0260 [Nocardioides dokdonensis FR1436]
MNDRLTSMMVHSVDRVPVSAAPLAEIQRAGRRRRRGAVALATIAVLTAGGAGATALARLGDPAAAPAPAGPGGQVDSGVPVLLDDSAFEVGVDRPRGADVLRGELRSTMDDRCLVVGEGRHSLHWPHEWTGRTFDDGRFVLYDQHGAEVAEVGDRVVLAGVLSGPAEWSGDQVCEPGVARVLQVESVRVE